ncbi:MAG TPA: DUF2934 domain-containing protein [Nitrospira sp.]|nr:DUF2934 domain-containing protein [Nitrospira sp.]
MPKKTQSVSRSTQRDAGVESRSNGNGVTDRPDEDSHGIHARISERAYALYEEHGRKDGHALEDWLAAEQHILNQAV